MPNGTLPDMRDLATGAMQFGGHAVLVHPGRRAAHEGNDAALRGGVVGLRDARRERTGREADQRAALLRAEHRRRGAEDRERALEVGLDDRIPLLLGHVEEHPLPQDAGDAHDAVDATERVDRPVARSTRRLPSS